VSSHIRIAYFRKPAGCEVTRIEKRSRAGGLLLELRRLSRRCLCVQRHVQEMQSRVCAELHHDGLHQAHRRGDTLDESLGTGTVDIRIDRHSQHSLHHRCLYTVGSTRIHAIFRSALLRF